MKPKFKIKDFTPYDLYFSENSGFRMVYSHYGSETVKSMFTDSLICAYIEKHKIEAFESFLTHNPKANKLTLQSAKELLKTFLDNQK
jgi:hypothetical protein